eukprot:138409_1
MQKFYNKDVSYLATVKNIDVRTQFLVFGYIRCIEVLFVWNIHIPLDIVLMCALYYYNPEYFTVHGSNMILKDKDSTVESMVESNFQSIMFTANTAYGKVEINKSDFIKCIWNFQIEKWDKKNTIVIGIAINKQNAEGIFIDEYISITTGRSAICGYNYGYRIDDTESEIYVTKVHLAVGGSCSLKTESFEDYGCIWNVGDMIAMELNVQNRTLKYYVNSTDQGIAVENVSFGDNVKYVMAVAFNGNAAIKLISFKEIRNI